jgi:3-dehydroquinate synthase
VLAFKLSLALGHAREADVMRTERHLSATGLPTRIGQIPGPRPKPEELLAHMRHDKKAQGGRLTFILAKGIGHAFITREVPEDAVRTVLAQD